jgi:hypothetical protein
MHVLKCARTPALQAAALTARTRCLRNGGHATIPRLLLLLLLLLHAGAAPHRRRHHHRRR